jgi:hypothetical protein
MVVVNHKPLKRGVVFTVCPAYLAAVTCGLIEAEDFRDCD